MFLPPPPGHDDNAAKPIPARKPMTDGNAQDRELFAYLFECLEGGSSPGEVCQQLAVR